MKSKKKIVLAYSGGLDTSIILKWLQENYDSEVICYTADVGQEIDRKKIITNAKKLGVKKIIIKDLKDIFVKEYVYPMIRGHAIYEGVYLLGTSIARPLIAKDQIRVNTICIGLIKSAQWERRAGSGSINDFYNELSKKVPMGKVGEEIDYANLVAFLSSKRSSYITGTAINLDGGLCPVV